MICFSHSYHGCIADTGRDLFESVTQAEFRNQIFIGFGIPQGLTQRSVSKSFIFTPILSSCFMTCAIMEFGPKWHCVNNITCNKAIMAFIHNAKCLLRKIMDISNFSILKDKL